MQCQKSHFASIRSYVYAYMNACMHACMHTYIHVCVFLCKWKYKYIYMYTYLCVCIVELIGSWFQGLCWVEVLAPWLGVKCYHRQFVRAVLTNPDSDLGTEPVRALQGRWFWLVRVSHLCTKIVDGLDLVRQVIIKRGQKGLRLRDQLVCAHQTGHP